MKHVPPGPLMIDVAGIELTDVERERLCHPLVGGVILFARNYVNPGQLEQFDRRYSCPAQSGAADCG